MHAISYSILGIRVKGSLCHSLNFISFERMSATWHKQIKRIRNRDVVRNEIKIMSNKVVVNGGVWVRTMSNTRLCDKLNSLTKRAHSFGGILMWSVQIWAQFFKNNIHMKSSAMQFMFKWSWIYLEYSDKMYPRFVESSRSLTSSHKCWIKFADVNFYDQFKSIRDILMNFLSE